VLRTVIGVLVDTCLDFKFLHKKVRDSSRTLYLINTAKQH
jgi:hypothetical protein